jgi:diacylglycerol kinase family enzyme
MVVGYGGDGTQHEIVNAVMGLDQLIGILPGGTGNGFGTGLGIPHSLRQAAEVIATSSKRLAVDVMLLGDDQYCLSRLYTGIEEDQQTSREMKDKYGVLAYGVSLLEGKDDEAPPAQYRLTIDGEVIEEQGLKCYVVNSASTGMNLKIGNFDVTDGWLDVFMLDKSKEKLGGAIDRFLRWETPNARSNYWRGREIVLEAEPSQPVWADGEFYGRTPVTVKVLPGALTVVVPESDPKKRQ